ncbi:hypothetical protein BBJ28_00003462 [Nothophytophthora sp. Chile5]|nr:hypothetical protein BBJ28_00003462 [Nothophytophthora sp. Chile5]
MSPLGSLAIIICAVLGSVASVYGDVVLFDGWIKFYAGIYYHDPYLTMNFTTPNRCFNMACDYLDGKIESARWSGLPISGIAGKAYIAFYTDLNCKGSREVIQLPHNGGVREFAIPQVKGNITSFMVLGESKYHNWEGSRNVCGWTGSNVTNGVVSEP